jgi:lysine 6-dehydrogenase
VSGVLILGGGMVGSAMAMDLAAQPGVEVTVADVRPEALDRLASKYGVGTIRCDLGDPDAVKRTVASYDMVFGALASAIGFQTLRAVIEAGKHCCDISFMSENAMDLDAVARERGVTAVVDCGVGPGLSNMMAGYGASVLDPCESIEIYVGGLPVERRWPFEYKAAFAPHDAIEEYVRPSRIVEHGKIVVREALSEPELLDFPGVGTLEAFNTDGLRSLAYTLDVPFMKEKTLRYRGHIELMRVLRAMGLFSKEPVDVAGTKVVPLAVTEKLMFPLWQYEDGERDLTVMRVIAAGKVGGAPRRYVWDLLDYQDPKTGVRSMSRTTAFPATIVGMMIARGEYRSPGVHPPEHLGREPGLLDKVLSGLAERGVAYSARVE